MFPKTDNFWNKKLPSFLQEAARVTKPRNLMTQQINHVTPSKGKKKRGKDGFSEQIPLPSHIYGPTEHYLTNITKCDTQEKKVWERRRNLNKMGNIPPTWMGGGRSPINCVRLLRCISVIFYWCESRVSEWRHGDPPPFSYPITPFRGFFSLFWVMESGVFPLLKMFVSPLWEGFICSSLWVALWEGRF